jgi:hypothetical protein
MSAGAQSDMHVSTTWTVDRGIPGVPSRLWVMLMSLLVHSPAISTTNMDIQLFLGVDNLHEVPFSLKHSIREPPQSKS